MRPFARFGTICTRLQPATLLKVTLLHGCLSHFLNCATGTKSRKAPYIVQNFNNEIVVPHLTLLLKFIWS